MPDSVSPPVVPAVLELRKVEVLVPPEMDDVRVALVELVKDIKAKKSIAELAGENLANLIKAIDGADKIPGEAKVALKESCVCGGLLGGQVLGEVLG